MTKMESQKPVIKDFRNFLFMVWQHLNLPLPTEIQYDLGYYLQHGPRRKIIEAFRGVGKSYVTSAYVCWRLLNNPELKFLVVSASKERADQFSTFTKRLIDEMDVLKHLKPRADQRDSKISFDVGPARASHSPSVKSVGITGQMSGSRADEIIADDIEVTNNSDTQTARDKLGELVKEFEAILKPEGIITFLGTPQTEESLYNKMRERGYSIRVWPAKYPTQKMAEAYGYNADGTSCLAPMILKVTNDNADLIGKPTEPKRFGEIDLLEREVSYGKAGFNLQFMLDTSLSDADKYPLKLSDLIIMDLDPDHAPIKLSWCNDPSKIVQDLPNMGFTGDRFYRPLFISQEFHPYTGAVMSIDPSGRGKDKTGYAVVKMLGGQLFLTAAGGIEGGYEHTTLEALAKIAKDNKVKYIVIEANFGDGMFTKLFEPVLGRIYPCTVEEVKHHTQKERRIIDTLEPIFGSHRLVVDRKVVQNDYESDVNKNHRLFYQLTHITKDRGSLLHDDALDALAIAVNYWTEQMARDTDRAASEIHTKMIEDRLRGWADGAMALRGGSSRHQKGWISRPV